jgi:hypothetical protein
VPQIEPTIRAQGVTPSERYVLRLCEQSFLSLWSYAGIYRDQGRSGGNGDGKEVCDLLVVFNEHIIIFSVKDCVVSDSGNLQLDWSRWYRKAIEKSAQQIWGAEKWICEKADQLYLDPSCTKPFPLVIPEDAKVHRVVVALGASERCRRDFGGPGSLMIVPDIVGADHVMSEEREGAPFQIGKIDPTKDFIHVLDDNSLDIVMGELDTITDFVTYLSKKEDLIASGRLESAAAEEDLLAHYLFPLEGKGTNDFILPRGVRRLSVEPGLWAKFEQDDYRRKRQQDNQISYLWDELIESSSRAIISGTELYASEPGISGGAQVFRFLARESRTRRRHLATSLHDMVQSAPDRPQFRYVRVEESTKPGDPFYAFLLLSADFPGVAEDQYREFRRELLAGLCLVVQLRYPHATDIVGIATEPGKRAFRSQDVVYRDARTFTAEARAQAEKVLEATGLLTNVTRSAGDYYDYPSPSAAPQHAPFRWPPPGMKGRHRNSPCPCRSGRKYKHCCGKAAA